MAKYVKTDYVPDTISYLTANKEYLLYDSDSTSGYFVCDTGQEIFVRFQDSCHILGRDWTVINR